LNDDMLSLVKKLVNTLEQDKTVLDDNLDQFEGDIINEFEEHIEIKEEIDKIDVEEFLLEPTKVKIKEVNVRIKKLPLRVKEGIILAQERCTKDEVSNPVAKVKEIGWEKPWRFGSTDGRFESTDGIGEIQENHGLKYQEYMENNCEESIEDHVVESDHSYASKVEKDSSQEEILSYFRVNIINNDQIFVCSECDQIFDSSEELAKHKPKHSKYFDFDKLCVTCDKKFESAEELREHKKNHKKTPKPKEKLGIVCDQCSKSLQTKQGWKNHMELHEEEKIEDIYKTIQCDECPMRFHFENQFKIHKHKKHMEVFCEKCGQKFPSEKNLNRHELSKHYDPTKPRPRPYSCDQCEWAFFTTTGLKKHKMKHNGGKPFSCNLCDKTFYSRWEMNEHQGTHGSEKKYECKECGKNLKFASTLYSHIKRHHSSDFSHECDICYRRFPLSYSLRAHKLSHLEESQWPFACDKCGQRFKTKQSMRDSVHVENNCPLSGPKKPRKKGIKRISGTLSLKERVDCDVCGKSMVKRYLKDHLVTHSSEREDKTQCNICGKSLRKHSLKDHLLNHSSERPFSCNECDKSFITKQVLEKHINAHTRPFHCDQCPKSFSSNHKLKAHLKVHTGERPYPCDQCTKRLSTKHNMKKHKEKYHNDKSEDTDNTWIDQVISSIS